jgi:hypothetical protein
MLGSTYVKIFNSKYLIFWVAQKWQNLKDLEVLKSCTVHYYRCQILSFLHNPEYMVFRVETLHVFRSQHCLQQRLFFQIFWNFESPVLNFSKTELHVARSTLMVFGSPTSYIVTIVTGNVILLVNVYFTPIKKINEHHHSLFHVAVLGCLKNIWFTKLQWKQR